MMLPVGRPDVRAPKTSERKGCETMNVEIDRNACIGCGVCVDTCADTFAMDQNHIAIVMREPDTNHEACAKAAESGCPTSAIVLH